jgi:23S rRNA (cytosine1962-C5)-methyltransferase
VNDTPPCVLFEDEHLLAVNKPAGLNTHAPSPYAGEGIYDWLRHREPRWASLAIVHRLDKDTSGVLVFAKSALANRSLTQQFTEHSIRKKYLLLTDRKVQSSEFTARSKLVRLGDQYASRPGSAGVDAETRFRVLPSERAGRVLVEAVPVTGRTHQIRVHAAEHGFPILGDTRYGGSAFKRVCLHSAELIVRHPALNDEVVLAAAPDFEAPIGAVLREALFTPERVNCYRLVHGSSDQATGWYVDRLGDYLLSTSEDDYVPTKDRLDSLAWWIKRYHLHGAYHKTLLRNPGAKGGTWCPRPVLGEPAADEFVVVENGIRFNLSFAGGYSAGLFLDQRDNRRRLLTNHVAAGFALFGADGGRPEVLNVFAYTCGFSVCAARAGGRTTSLDLSRNYLEWGKRNFRLNEINPDDHDFIYGDAFDRLRRLEKKRRTFDLIILDPPTFSRSKQYGVFQAENDYGRLLTAALPLLKNDGVILASTNSASLKPEDFVEALHRSVRQAKRTIQQEHFFPQPPDFPITRQEPGYLKTVWLRISAS